MIEHVIFQWTLTWEFNLVFTDITTSGASLIELMAGDWSTSLDQIPMDGKTEKVLLVHITNPSDGINTLWKSSLHDMRSCLLMTKCDMRRKRGRNREPIERPKFGVTKSESSWFQRCCECVHLNKKCVSSHKSSQTSKFLFDVCMSTRMPKNNTKTFEKGSYICTVKKSSVNGKLCLFHSLIQFTTSCIQECVFNDLLDNFTLKRKIQNMTWNELNF